MKPRNITRKQMLAEAERIKAKVEQIFIDIAYWNNHTRKPGEDIIDPDPDGQLKRLAAQMESAIRQLQSPLPVEARE